MWYISIISNRSVLLSLSNLLMDFLAYFSFFFSIVHILLWESSMDFAWKSSIFFSKFVCFGHHSRQSQYRFSFTQIYLTSCRFACLFIFAIAKKYAYTPFFFYLPVACNKNTISMRRLWSICSCYLDCLECIVVPMFQAE